MFEYLGWTEVSELITKSLEETIHDKTVTYDFHRQMDGATLVKTSEFAANMIKKMA